jgi:hypothetical protein
MTDACKPETDTQAPGSHCIQLGLLGPADTLARAADTAFCYDPAGACLGALLSSRLDELRARYATVQGHLDPTGAAFPSAVAALLLRQASSKSSSPPRKPRNECHLPAHTVAALHAAMGSNTEYFASGEATERGAQLQALLLAGT